MADPSVIRSIAVSAEAVVDSFVYTKLNPGTAVLRVTPPFHGRMRARLHVARAAGTTSEETGAIHLEPATLLESAAVDTYPTLESAEGDFESDAPAVIRAVHEATLDRWREQALEAVVESVTIETDDGLHAVEIKRMH